MSSPFHAEHIVQADSSKHAEAMAHPASFKLLYFPLMGRGSTSRDILTFGGAKFENIHPPNWPQDKPHTPFGGLPVLFITGKNGQEVTLSESAVIETYLADHFGLLGDNAYERAFIRAIHNSASDLQTGWGASVMMNHPETKDKCRASFVNVSLPNMFGAWERHLVDNGSNGHFVGNKLSLADIRVSNFLEHLACQPMAENDLLPVMRNYPNVFKLRESVARHPKLHAWRTSEQWSTFEKNSKGFFATAGPK
ncbi:hypothetical protein BGZ94_002493 [Podila epigama]|nr:hypothetical protein BGZ94_002493 [Podila epigama]